MDPLKPQGEEGGAQPKPPVDPEFCDDCHSQRPVNFGRSRSLAWLDGAVHDREDVDDNLVTPPPVCIVLHPDIIDEGWGWNRLVPYSPGAVDWPDFKKYLVTYFHNTDKDRALFGKRKPEPVGQSGNVAAEHDPLKAAVDLCVKIENELLISCIDEYTPEDIFLSVEIKERAKQLINSGCESSAAAAALLCVIKEGELMCELLIRQFETSETVIFCNMVRRFASNRMLYKGSESDADAAAGVMLSIANEAKLILDSLSGGHLYVYMEYLIS